MREFGAAAAANHTTVDTKHLTLSSSASASVVRSGQHIELTLEIELKPKMHVYAPGVEGGYRPIEWSVNSSAAATAGPPVFPKPEILFLEAIQERVPVYREKVRLVRDLGIGRDAALKPVVSANGEFTVEGEFKYQACDDRVCYIPATIPLKWTFTLENHDRQRAPAELRRK
ncbi:MAG TPA: protein-disulfide reductase DsbD domain-containing protein [Bryobacteraceae bacterium]